MAVVSLALDALEWLRVQFGGRPLMLWLLLGALGLAIAALRGGATRVPARLLTRFIGAFAGVALAGYAAIAVWYAAIPHYFDYAEPTVTIVGWLSHLGLPVYHAIDSPERYSHVWGPMVFVVHGWSLALFGPSIAASKWVGSAAALASLAMLFAALRPVASARRAIVFCGLAAAVLLIFRNVSFWTRSEPLQLLSVSASLALAARGRGLGAAVLIGLCSGFQWNLKFTGPLFSLPVFALLAARSGWPAAAAAGVVASVTAAVPFVALSNVSFTHYLDWVGVSGGNGLRLALVRQNLELAFFIGVPLLLAYFAVPRAARATGREWRWLLASLAAAAAGVSVAASKPGAGAYHLIPLLPSVWYAVAYALRGAPAIDLVDPRLVVLASAFVVSLGLLAPGSQAQLVRVIQARAQIAGDAVTDLQRFMGSHPGVIEMGYGTSGGEFATLARPVLVFRNGSYLLDSPAIREHQLGGVSLPPATTAAVRECRADFFLVPKGQDPFSQPNPYPERYLAPMYPLEFRQAFATSYRPAGATALFDVFECRTRRAP